MPQDTNIPIPHNPESPRAFYQALAERTGVLAPGATLSDELLAFAEEVAKGAAGQAPPSA
ncbi:aminoglycoside phosphotransferase [Variovorax sp. J22P271]|uniref:aminoglycoside phosphotransferase n=1 Tax=Variovorax davisae TaxID=3053515 RepID=UPI002574DA3B|nr:aminoglycoside phosphotransferase [Variovorax sp. J22P271]MDM0036817.1 aminoglycoside phosphotransferase [Variovorax sp. J22P271]